MAQVPITLVYRGRSHAVAAPCLLVDELVEHARAAFEQLTEDDEIRLVHKGKVLTAAAGLDAIAGKVMVMATARSDAADLNARRADPTIRGFDAEDRAIEQRKAESAELQAVTSAISKVWRSGQDARYRFSRLQPVSWQSFGTRPGERTPHQFAARELLEKLATDPGVVACMRARELVVGSLGEMDPIDDRLMLAKRGEGGDLLGYNTNGGMRIDIKLRTDDLSDFMPYPQLAETLLHELCHNWVGDHNVLFWTLFAQMRVEYLHEHMRLAASGVLIDGQTSAALAGVRADCAEGGRQIAAAVLGGIAREVSIEMAQHLEKAVRDHIALCQAETGGALAGRVLGELAQAVGAGDAGEPSRGPAAPTDRDVRARAAAAAESRARRDNQTTGGPT